MRETITTIANSSVVWVKESFWAKKVARPRRGIGPTAGAGPRPVTRNGIPLHDCVFGICWLIIKIARLICIKWLITFMVRLINIIFN